jgi:hypothetical protein
MQNMKKGIDLGFLGKDHQLSMDKKVSMMFETLYGVRENGRLASPGIIHAIQGVFGVKKNEKGEDEQVQLGLGMADIVQAMNNDVSLNASQLLAICRLLKIDPASLAFEAGNTKANLEFNTQLENCTKELIKQQEEQKIKEAAANPELPKEQTNA